MTVAWKHGDVTSRRSSHWLTDDEVTASTTAAGKVATVTSIVEVSRRMTPAVVTVTSGSVIRHDTRHVHSVLTLQRASLWWCQQQEVEKVTSGSFIDTCHASCHVTSIPRDDTMQHHDIARLLRHVTSHTVTYVTMDDADSRNADVIHASCVMWRRMTQAVERWSRTRKRCAHV